MRLLAAWLGLLVAGCALAGEAAAPPVTAAPAAASAAGSDGRAAYARHCLTCHQADGYGVPNMQPAITGGPWVRGDANALALFVMTGGFNSAERKEGDSHNVMPAFRQLGDEELAAILTYIRQAFGQGASAVTSAQVAQVRATLPGQ